MAKYIYSEGNPSAKALLPEGGGGAEEWEVINEVTVSEAVQMVDVSTDSNGQQFSLSKALVYMHTPKTGISCGSSLYIARNSSAASHSIDIIVNTHISNNDRGQYTVIYVFKQEHDGRMSAIAGANYSASVQPTLNAIDGRGVVADEITRIAFKSEHSSALFEVGATIKIYGVRSK